MRRRARGAGVRQAGAPVRDFTYVTLDSWSPARRVIGKAERARGEAIPRFVVTIAMASACPYQQEWALAHASLRQAAA